MASEIGLPRRSQANRWTIAHRQTDTWICLTFPIKIPNFRIHCSRVYPQIGIPDITTATPSFFSYGTAAVGIPSLRLCLCNRHETASSATGFTFHVSIRFLLHALRPQIVLTIVSTVSPNAVFKMQPPLKEFVLHKSTKSRAYAQHRSWHHCVPSHLFLLLYKTKGSKTHCGLLCC
jgi:hypothetical protein